MSSVAVGNEMTGPAPGHPLVRQPPAAGFNRPGRVLEVEDAIDKALEAVGACRKMGITAAV